MDIIKEKAQAKLNISLDVTERRSDGYHNMLMVMQSVSLCDDIIIHPNDSGIISAKSNLPFIPADQRNLAVKAAYRFYEAAGLKCPGLLIETVKNIPVGSGMGGGSSDAAAVLRALNRFHGQPFDLPALQALACDIGSDVAFCVSGGTALASGRGEILSPLPPLPPCGFVICKPEFSISTPELFKRLDQISLRRHPDTAGLVEAIEKGDLSNICRRMYNVFEDIDDRRLRTVAEIKSRLLDLGALGAVMTGTGSAVFGIFPEDAPVEELAEPLKNDFGFSAFARATERFF